MKKLNVGLDIDGTIDASEQSIRFFKLLTHLMYDHAEIHIITNREPGSEATIAHELRELGIQFHHLKITGNKAGYIRDRNIKIFYENEDEMFQTLGKDILVLKVREEGNYNYKTGRWYGSKKTVEMID